MILLITGVIFLALDGRKAAWAGVAAVALYGVSLLLTGTIREREDWRAAYEYLAGAAAPGDVVAICPAFNYPSLRYHATAPVAAAVVTTVDGQLAAIEGPLGSDRHWDRTYFQKIERPLTMARIAGEGTSAIGSGAAGTLELTPAQSIWRVDGHCTEASDDMDRALAAAGADPGIVRFETDTSRGSAISIREYRVVAPTTLEVQSLAARP